MNLSKWQIAKSALWAITLMAFFTIIWADIATRLWKNGNTTIFWIIVIVFGALHILGRITTWQTRKLIEDTRRLADDYRQKLEVLRSKLRSSEQEKEFFQKNMNLLKAEKEFTGSWNAPWHGDEDTQRGESGDTDG